MYVARDQHRTDVASSLVPFGPVPHSQYLISRSIESRHPQSEPSNCGWRFHPLKPKGVQEAPHHNWCLMRSFFSKRGEYSSPLR